MQASMRPAGHVHVGGEVAELDAHGLRGEQSMTSESGTRSGVPQATAV